MQPKVFESGMDRLVELFGEVSAKKTALYWDSLKHLPDGGFVLAVKEAVKRCEFFPKPKQLLDFAAPYRLPVVKRPYNERQLAECSVTQAEEAREWLRRLAAGVADEPVRSDGGVCMPEHDRRLLLRQQAEQLVSG